MPVNVRSALWASQKLERAIHASSLNLVRAAADQ